MTVDPLRTAGLVAIAIAAALLRSPYDQCPKCAEPYEQTYGIPAGYTNIVCDKCSGADADATRWALDDRWAPEWGGAAA